MTAENTIAEITASRKDELVNALLVYMKNDMENSGKTIKLSVFNFRLSKPEGNDLKLLKLVVDITDKEFDVVMKSCMTHEYIKKMCCGTDYDYIQLTNTGFARAKSVEKAKHHKPQETQQITFNGTINAGNLQIGNNNTQNIENVINNLLNEIEKTNATDEEKKEAKNLVSSFFNNPIVSSVISTTANAAIAILAEGM